MKLEFRKASLADTEQLIEIYNASFYDDYIKYGECPAYGKTKEVMEKSILDYPKFLILCNERPVGWFPAKKGKEDIRNRLPVRNPGISRQGNRNTGN